MMRSASSSTGNLRYYSIQTQPILRALTKNLQIIAIEPSGLVHVLQETTGGSDEDVHASDTVAFDFEVLAANDQTGREVVFPTNLAQDLEDLDSQLARGRHNQCAQTIGRVPPLAIEDLEHRNKERQRLAAACLCCAQHIPSRQRKWDRLALNLGQLAVIGLLETTQCLGRNRELIKVLDIGVVFLW